MYYTFFAGCNTLLKRSMGSKYGELCGWLPDYYFRLLHCEVHQSWCLTICCCVLIYFIWSAGCMFSTLFLSLSHTHTLVRMLVAFQKCICAVRVINCNSEEAQYWDKIADLTLIRYKFLVVRLWFWNIAVYWRNGFTALVGMQLCCPYSVQTFT